MIRKDIRCFSNNMEDIRKTFPDYYYYALIHQDIEHYVCQNVMVKSYRMAELFGLNLREAYLDYNVIDFVLSLEHNLITKGALWEFLKGSRITKYLHRISMKKILPEQILNKPKQGGFIPMALLLTDLKRRKGIFRYLLSSEVLREASNMDYIKMVITECKNCLNGNPYWQAYQDNKVNQVMNLLVFSLWYHFVLNSRQLSPPKCTLSHFIE